MLLLHELRKTMSRIDKEFILKRADTFDKKVFYYAYNPDWTYGLKFNYINWKSVKQPEQVTFILLDRLESRELTGNLARGEVEKHAAKYGDLIKLICNKDLDCGVTATTLNKVFGKNFVPQFKVQLAVEVPIVDCPLPCIGQLKYNGVRVIAKVTNQSVKFFTRSGKTFEYPALAEELQKTRSFMPFDGILDGELTFGDSRNSNHTQVSGLVNSAIQGNPIRAQLTFNIFDYMDLKVFNSQLPTNTYDVRFKVVEDIVNQLDCYFVRVAETYEFYTHADIQTKFDEFLKKGYEGLILKTWQHKYTYKRSKDWIKLKAIKTADLFCTGFIEGTGKYTNEIGALICEGNVEGKEIVVDVGSGLTDKDRATPISEYLDKYIEVKYNTVIQDSKTGEWSLFLPRFVTIRGDM